MSNVAKTVVDAVRMAMDYGPGQNPNSHKSGGHLSITAHPEGSGQKKFSASASSHSEVEKHMSSLHAHIKKNNLGSHNVSIENKKTGEVHSAKISPHGIHQKSYTHTSF